jgi:hypothetical protein
MKCNYIKDSVREAPWDCKSMELRRDGWTKSGKLSWHVDGDEHSHMYQVRTSNSVTNKSTTSQP